MPCLRLLMLLLLLLLLATPPWLHAAPPESVPADDDMAPRVLACVACHGREGRATNQGYFPRIAGKPAGYLYNQLLNFRDGRRSYPPMALLLEHLTDGYLLREAYRAYWRRDRASATRAKSSMLSCSPRCCGLTPAATRAASA